MKRLSILLLVAVLGACVPVLAPHAERDGQKVVITLAPTVDVHSVTLSVLNATTTDPRCVALGETDLGCTLGDLEANTVTTITVTGPPGAVRCMAFGITDPDRGLAAYRSWPCN